MNKKIAGLVCLLVCAASMVFAGSPDYRVKSRLDAKGFNYKIDDEGDFRIILKFDNGRTQLLWVNSNTENYKGMEIREVWSTGYKGYISSNIMKNLLRGSQTKKLGAWGVNKDFNRAYFTAKIPADLDRDALINTIWFVGEAADEFERDYMGGDDL